MLPVIPQVVHILDRGPHLLKHVVDWVCFIDDFALVFRVRHRIYVAVNPELVQMAILPTHDYLQRAMELSEPCVFPNLNAPPDRRMNVAQRHLELIYGTVLFHRHECVSVSRKA